MENNQRRGMRNQGNFFQPEVPEPVPRLMMSNLPPGGLPRDPPFNPLFGNFPPLEQNPFEVPPADVVLLNSPFFVNQLPPSTLPRIFVPSLQPLGSYHPYQFDNYIPSYLPMFQNMLTSAYQMNPDAPPLSIANTMEQFKKLPLNEQLKEFIYSRTLSMDQVRIRWQLVYDICLLLRKRFPDCEGYAFGSLLSGLSDSGSDIDLLIRIQEKDPLKPLDALSKVLKMLRNPVCPHSPIDDPFLLDRPLAIKHARVPIVRINHDKSRLQVDLSFGNRLGVQNSKLVVLYTNLDERVFRFLVLVRYWLKFHQLSGPELIKNYGLTLLALVYLMIKGIIPSVHMLQKFKQDQRREQARFLNTDEIDSWDASFCEDTAYIRAHFSQSSPVPKGFKENPGFHLLQLVGDFLTMCGNINFGNVLVSPLLGEIVMKANYFPGHEWSLPESMERYVNFCKKHGPGERLNLNAVLCIQDPFCLAFNVTKPTGIPSIVKFQLAALKTGQVIRDKLANNDHSLSLLDMFIPVPHKMNMNRVILKWYKSEWRAKRWREEFLRAFDIQDEPSNHLKTSEKVLLNQSNGFVTLPPHLIELDKIFGGPGGQMKHVYPDCEVHIMHCPTGKFASKFFDELKRARVWRPGFTEWIPLAQKMVAIWRSFMLDFLRECMEDGLKLKIVGEELEATKWGGFYNMEEMLGMEMATKWTSQNFCDKKVGKNFYSVETVRQLNEALDKVVTIPDTEETLYKMFTVEVDYPFWKMRQGQKNPNTKVERSSGVVENPLVLEGSASEKAKKEFLNGIGTSKRPRMEANFEPFQVNVMIKMSCCLENRHLEPKWTVDEENGLATVAKPVVRIMIQAKDPELNVFVPVSQMMELIQQKAQNYLLFRLSQWFGEIEGIDTEYPPAVVSGGGRRSK